MEYVSIFFYKLRRALLLECLKNSYFAFIYPHILCDIEVYGTASASHMNKLVKLNNKILIILEFRNTRSRVGESYK
jgi:hypothetical protein